MGKERVDLSRRSARLVPMYCRYYSGRRCRDDLRQIGRWRAVRRHVAQLKSIARGAIYPAAGGNGLNCSNVCPELGVDGEPIMRARRWDQVEFGRVWRKRALKRNGQPCEISDCGASQVRGRRFEGHAKERRTKNDRSNFPQKFSGRPAASRHRKFVAQRAGRQDCLPHRRCNCFPNENYVPWHARRN
jgi:hypothetical protein